MESKVIKILSSETNRVLYSGSDSLEVNLVLKSILLLGVPVRIEFDLNIYDNER